MTKIVNLFNELGAVHQHETPSALLGRLVEAAPYYDKAVVLLINDKAGMWETSWEASGMNNAEVILALNILERQIMDTVLGKG
jgi:hypothetical protein